MVRYIHPAIAVCAKEQAELIRPKWAALDGPNTVRVLGDVAALERITQVS